MRGDRRQVVAPLAPRPLQYRDCQADGLTTLCAQSDLPLALIK